MSDERLEPPKKGASTVFSIAPAKKPPKPSVTSEGEDDLSEIGSDISKEDISTFFQTLLQRQEYSTRSDNIRVFSYQDLTSETNPDKVVQGQFRCDEKESGYNITVEKNVQGQLSMRCSSADQKALHNMIQLQINAIDNFGLERKLILSGDEAAIKTMKNICDGFQPPIPYEIDKGNQDSLDKKNQMTDRDTSTLKFNIN